MNRVTFKKDLCKGCELCVHACPKKIIVLNLDEINQKGYHPAFVTNMEKCTGCAMCAVMCPDIVITVERMGKGE